MLTDRELQLLRLMAAGHSNSSIGAELHLSPNTVKEQVSAIYRKLGVGGRMQAVLRAQARGLLGPDEDPPDNGSSV